MAPTNSSSNSVDMHSRKSNIPLLTCAILAALTTGGPTYAFGLYGACLKDALALTQSQLDTLSSANFCAGLLTWMPGMLVDRYGVKRSMAAGGILGAIFMTLYWAVARQFILSQVSTSCLIAVLCACGVCIFLSNGLVIGAVYKLLVCSTATRSKGSAVGVAKGYVGLGSGVYACIFQGLKASKMTSSDLDFLPMAAVLAVAACTIPAWALLPCQPDLTEIWQLPSQERDLSTNRHFAVLYVGLLALAVMVMGTSVSELMSSFHDPDEQEEDPVRHARRSLETGFMLLALWVGPILGQLLLPTKHGNESEEQQSAVFSVRANYQKLRLQTLDQLDPESMSSLQFAIMKQHAGEHTALLQKQHEHTSTLPSKYCCQDTASTIASLENEYEQTLIDRTPPLNSVGTVRKDNQSKIIGDYTLLDLLQTCHAYSLLWIGIVLVGSGTMMTNNMAQMVESLELSQTTVTPASMAIFSVAQALSRIGTGALSDVALTHYGVPRPWALVVAAMVAMLAHALLALVPEQYPTMFLLGVTFSGVAFGMIWPLMVLLVGEIFGTAFMATNYLFYDGTASAAGTLLLAKFVTQEVYESHITNENSTTCLGTQCFQKSHWVVVILALSCVGAAYYLLRQTKNIYRAP